VRRSAVHIGGVGALWELYSCSSSMGTPGRSWVAMRRPVAGTADSRVAIEDVVIWRGSRRARGGAARTVIVMGRQRGSFGVGVTFRSNAYWTSLNRTPRRRRRHNNNKPAASSPHLTPYVVFGSAAMPEQWQTSTSAPFVVSTLERRHVVDLCHHSVRVSY
jgi:hypothetical protein